jgi:hypothetical protein
MKKYKCYSKENPKGFEIKGNFPDKIMVCYPLQNIKNPNKEDFFLIIPQETNERLHNIS